jgi:hypothetical protein
MIESWMVFLAALWIVVSVIAIRLIDNMVITEYVTRRKEKTIMKMCAVFWPVVIIAGCLYIPVVLLISTYNDMQKIAGEDRIRTMRGYYPQKNRSHLRNRPRKKL